jgi:hypothetical protein
MNVSRHIDHMQSPQSASVSSWLKGIFAPCLGTCVGLESVKYSTLQARANDPETRVASP